MKKIVEIKFGSHLYGTDTPKSDLDFKAIYLPTAKEIILGTYKQSINTSRPKGACERNTKDDIDMEVFSLDRYLGLLAEGQTVAFDMLFAWGDHVTCFGEDGYAIWQKIKNNKDKFFTRNINAFVGYARQQASRYGIKGSRMDVLKRVLDTLDSLPLYDKLTLHKDKLDDAIAISAEFVSLEGKPLLEWVDVPGPDKVTMLPHLHICGRKLSITSTVKHVKEICKKIYDGYGARAYKAHLSGGKDYKALSHAVRVNYEALELLKTGYVTFPRPERQLLLDIKLEKIPFDQISEIIEQGLVELAVAHEESTLPDKPDYEWINQFVYEVYSDIIKIVDFYSL